MFDLGFEENKLITVPDIQDWSPEQLDQLRYNIQTDLYFLANNILRNAKRKPLLRHVHGNICDTLVHKFPTSERCYQGKVPGDIVPLEEWSPVKERVILSSRGTLKSVVEAADVVQIILCEPNVRIILMSGKLGAAQSILRMSRSFFESNGVLGFLFPEYCSLISVNAKEFTSPGREDVELRDPTLQIATFGSVKAGAHGEWIKLDDATNEVNQATVDLVAKSIESYDDLDPLLEPGGYIDFTGTRWAPDDLPEYIIRNGIEMEKETGEKHVYHLFQPVWTVKKVEDDGIHSPIQLAQMQRDRDERERKHRLIPEDVNLLWPEKLNARFLWPMYRKNPAKFAKQYLLNPDSVTTGVFTRTLLARQTKPLSFMPMPHQSYIFINWDLAGISGKGDFSVGIVGVWETSGRLFILDCIIEQFTSSTMLCQAIVKFFKKYQPDNHRIEAANGTEYLAGELQQIAKAAKLERAFHPGFDAPSNTKDAKQVRIRQLAGALERDMLQFYEGMDQLDELYKQFEKFSGKGKYKDDGPDAIAQMYVKWKDSIAPKAVGYLSPSTNVVDFASEGPNVRDKNFGKNAPAPDPHADERMNADFEFLKRFTVPH